jgi:hypothetical protein
MNKTLFDCIREVGAFARGAFCVLSVAVGAAVSANAQPDGIGGDNCRAIGVSYAGGIETIIYDCSGSLGLDGEGSINLGTQCASPFADASATSTIVISANGLNGLTAPVTLDGSRSWGDPNAYPLFYRWVLISSPGTLATGAVAEVTLPVGTNLVMLAIQDSCPGKEINSGSTETVVSIEVITPTDAINRIAATVENGLGERNRTPLLASLRAAGMSFNTGNFFAASKKLAAFQSKVRAQIAPCNAGLATDLIQAAEAIIEVFQ